MKICSSCKKKKKEDRFSWKVKGKIKQSKCRSCSRMYSKSHYKDNSDQYKSKNLKVRDRNKAFIIKYLKSQVCIDCGIFDIRVLEFDHVRGIKTKSISQMIQDGYSLLSLQKEINKCDIRCANCHRIKTNNQLGWFKNNI